MMKTLTKAVLFFAMLYLIPFVNDAKASIELQQLIDATEPNGELLLEAKQYEGPAIINKPISIKGMTGTSIQSTTTGLLVQNTNDVHLKMLAFETVESPLQIENSQQITVDSLTFTVETKGVIVKEVSNLTMSNVSITGTKQGHFYFKPHGMEIYDSNNVTVTKAQTENTQDGIYFEEVDDIQLTDSKANNGRYGFHFMYVNDVTVARNIVSNNTTGFMMMIVDQAHVEDNTILRQLSLNSIGLYLYDVKNALVTSNQFLENANATVWHNVTATKFENNLFQANSTVVQSTKSPKVEMTSNDMIGNILLTRSDQDGFVLHGNSYDDYTGYDFNQDLIGDTPHQTFTSFGQWMVRKPVYQYFIEAPSVVLLNKMDGAAQTVDDELLIDKEPVMQSNSLNLTLHLNWLQLLLGLFGIFGISIGWRKLR